MVYRFAKFRCDWFTKITGGGGGGRMPPKPKHVKKA